MASRETVTDFVAYLAGRFGEGVAVKCEGAYFEELVEDLQQYANDDVWSACKLLRVELEDIKPWENVTAKILPYLAHARDNRRAEEASRELRQAGIRRDVDGLRSKLSPVTDAEMQTLQGPQPTDTLQASIYRMRCKGIRSRLNLTAEDRSVMERKLAQLTTEIPERLTDGS